MDGISSRASLTLCVQMGGLYSLNFVPCCPYMAKLVQCYNYVMCETLRLEWEI